MPSPMLIAPEVIDCIAQGRAPSVAELHRVADQIAADLGTRSAFRWGGNHPNENERSLILRAAHAALLGTAEPLR